MSAQEDGLGHGLVGVEGPSLGIVREIHAEVGPQGLGRGVLELLGQHPQPAIKHPSMHCHKAPVFSHTHTLLQTTRLCTATRHQSLHTPTPCYRPPIYALPQGTSLSTHPHPATDHPSMHCHKAPVFAHTHTLLQTTHLCTATPVFAHTLLQTTRLCTATRHRSLHTPTPCYRPPVYALPQKKNVFVLTHTLLQTTRLCTATMHPSLHTPTPCYKPLAFALLQNTRLCMCACSHTQATTKHKYTRLRSDRLLPSVFKSDSSVFQSTPSASSKCWRTG